MGKGRPWSRALRSKVTPTGRWVPKTNSHAVCVGIALDKKSGGGRSGVKNRFIAASKACAGK
jgi:hypothetical protein